MYLEVVAIFAGIAHKSFWTENTSVPKEFVTLKPFFWEGGGIRFLGAYIFKFLFLDLYPVSRLLTSVELENSLRFDKNYFGKSHFHS